MITARLLAAVLFVSAPSPALCADVHGNRIEWIEVHAHPIGGRGAPGIRTCT